MKPTKLNFNNFYGNQIKKNQLKIIAGGAIPPPPDNGDNDDGSLPEIIPIIILGTTTPGIAPIEEIP